MKCGLGVWAGERGGAQSSNNVDRRAQSFLILGQKRFKMSPREAAGCSLTKYSFHEQNNYTVQHSTLTPI